jgi:hypothetical protein
MGEARTAELWLKIDQLHLKFLQANTYHLNTNTNTHEQIQADETPAKLEQRTKLEGLVAEYLNLVPHDRKFVSASTGDLIANSVKVGGGGAVCWWWFWWLVVGLVVAGEWCSGPVLPLPTLHPGPSGCQTSPW